VSHSIPVGSERCIRATRGFGGAATPNLATGRAAKTPARCRRCTSCGSAFPATGETWSKLRLDTRGVGSIEIVYTRPQTVYAGGGDGLWKSTDGGATWQRLSLPPYR
jgi:photosystem II stability/assembly factor-like uncharacterized protein